MSTPQLEPKKNPKKQPPHDPDSQHEKYPLGGDEERREKRRDRERGHGEANDDEDYRMLGGEA